MKRLALVFALVLGAGCPGPKAEQRPADASITPPTPDAQIVGTRWPDLVACDAGEPTENLFCDVTAAAGIDRVQTADAGVVMAGGVAVADFDGDGDLDIYVAGLATDGVFYRNDGSGGFTDDTAAAGLTGVSDAAGVGAVDLDNDGDQDLIVTGVAVAIRLYENDGSGGFTEVAGAFGSSIEWTASVAVGDYDNDGDLDVYITKWLDPASANLDGAANLLFRNEGSLAFTNVTGGAGVSTELDHSSSAAFADFDGNGSLDLFVANDVGMLSFPNVDLRNNGAGAFSPASSGAELGMFAKSAAVADFDGDGDPDIYVTDLGNNVLLQNDGSGRFADVASDVALRGGSYADVDEAVGTRPTYDPVTQPGLYAWAARALDFGETRHTAAGWAAVWLDYDQDGWLDLYVCNGYLGYPDDIEGRRQPNFMFHNRGDGLFEDVSLTINAADTGDARGCAAGDFDGDGDLDLVVANVGQESDASGGRVVLLRNDAIDNNYVRVHLQGMTSNRDGIGAKIELTVGGVTQTRWVTGPGFLSSSQRDPHFGVAANTTVDSIVVTWPSGTVDTLTAQAANATITIVEGSSP